MNRIFELASTAINTEALIGTYGIENINTRTSNACQLTISSFFCEIEKPNNK